MSSKPYKSFHYIVALKPYIFEVFYTIFEAM